MVRWSFALLLVVLPRAAGAEADDGRAAFERGRQLYLAGDYQDALPHLQQAYELSGRRPSTTLALGKCLRAIGDIEGALLRYEDYLAVRPRPPDAAKIELEVAELKAELKRDRDPNQEPDFLDQQRRPAPSAPPEWEAEPSLTSAPPEPALLERPIFWVGVAAVAVIAGGLALTFALGSSPEDPLGGTLGVVLQR
jgi:tetratricopeptide (TPR) repeat protein